MAEEHEIVADLHEIIDDLIEETEEELGRDLDDGERDSVIDEFLAGLDEDDEGPADEEPQIAAAAQAVANDDRMNAVKDVIAAFTPEELSGLYVWVNVTEGKAVIDQMDWHDGKAGKTIGAVLEDQFGKDSVEWQNEGPKPEGEGWTRMISSKISANQSARETLTAEDVRQQVRRSLLRRMP